MIISSSHWSELSAFVRDLGYNGAVLDSPAFRQSCEQYLQLLLQKNEFVNLTGAKDMETLFWKHLADSLALLCMEPLGTVVDWGSGGGLPGIPLALARKHGEQPGRVLFVDSVGKKVRAIEEFCKELGLENTAPFIGRGEDLIKSGSLKGAQAVVMRAVAPPERAVKWLNRSIPNWIFFLGPSQREAWELELPALSRRKVSVTFEKNLSLPHAHGERCLFRLSFSST